MARRAHASSRDAASSTLWLARDAVAIVDRTDFLVWRGEALLDLGEVQRLAEGSASFARAVNDALRLFEAKGHVVLAKRARALLRQWAVGLRPA